MIRCILRLKKSNLEEKENECALTMVGYFLFDRLRRVGLRWFGEMEWKDADDSI